MVFGQKKEHNVYANEYSREQIGPCVWGLKLGTYANSADTVQLPQHAATDLGLHFLLTGIFLQNAFN